MRNIYDMMDKESKEKLKRLDNEFVNNIIKEYASLCSPSKIIVLDDSEEDMNFIRDFSVRKKEESVLSEKGHTVHFDSLYDQGRDIENTRVLVSKGRRPSKAIRTIEREKGLEEIRGLMKDIMGGKEMIVKLYCLGPLDSRFSIPALQITDSAYVVHSEDILYRQGYRQFMDMEEDEKNSFFYFIHSAGGLKGSVSRDTDKRRIYVDLEENRVFTINNQYAGNSIGLKKLALRLAIGKAHKEDWLCEHMFIMGVKRKGRKTYFSGAFPSGCGKTSTAMIPGQTIIGDDIAYLVSGKDGNCYAANVEQGIFGIIKDVNKKDDPLIYRTLTAPGEIIFSNILVKDKRPYWLGMGKELPTEGINYSGEWYLTKTDEDGKEIPAAHKNARYAIRISELSNADENLNNPEGVPIKAIIYGGRDSDTSVPVVQSLSWAHGVFIGSALESETFATSLEREGLRKHNPMSNVEFLTVPLGTYIENHLRFGNSLDKPPLIFSTNYFLKKDGEYLNEKTDKKVWIMWMEGRVYREYDAIRTPVGYIPKYDDLEALFMEIFEKEYSKEDYVKQFSLRIGNYIEKLDRIEKIFWQEEEIPNSFFLHLEQQKARLEECMRRFGKKIISPFDFESCEE
jgi:phosphoenolpyruvate carboxykinase (GTP)